MYYNCRHEPVPIFVPGNKVWLDGSNITTNWLTSKLLHWQLSPFTIGACIRHGTYRLTLPSQLCCLHLVFPVVKQSPPLDTCKTTLALHISVWCTPVWQTKQQLVQNSRSVSASDKWDKVLDI
jgi:hypothetical protein